MKCIPLIAQVLIAFYLIAACTVSDAVPTPLRSPVIPTPSENVSPISTIATPMSVESLGPSFRLDPIAADATEATGQGPVGFTLVIVDATSGAQVLGSGQADKDGRFRIPLNDTPRPGHLMGLTVDLAPDQLASEDLIRQLYDIRGPGFRIIPQIVIVFDAVEVPER